MRVLLDLQGCQLAGGKSVAGSHLRNLVKALLQQAKGCDFWLAMNGQLPDILKLRQEFEPHIAWHRIQVFDIPGPVALRKRNNGWRNSAAILIRQAFIEHIAPDIVFLSDAVNGFDDDAIAAVADPQSAHTVSALFDLAPLLDERSSSSSQTAWRREKIENLRKASILLVKSETDRQTVLTRFDFASEKIISITAGHDCDLIAKDAGRHGTLASKDMRQSLETTALKQEQKYNWATIAGHLLETLKGMQPVKASSSIPHVPLDTCPPPDHDITSRPLCTALRNIQGTPGPTPADLAASASCIAANKPIPSTPRLFVDVSAIREVDHGTGIQRVVKNILRCLNYKTDIEYVIHPVYICRDRQILCHTDCCTYDPDRGETLNDEPIEFACNDIFVGLDLSAETAHIGEKIIRKMRDKGVRIYFVIYDLLPIHLPHYFLDGVGQAFTKWLRLVVELADGVICISKTIADELLRWLTRNRVSQDALRLKIGCFHLGSDIIEDATAISVPPVLHDTLSAMTRYPALLMVGTLEPRKGHAQTLAAFDLLWRRGIDANLVIAGKQGWHVEALVKALRTHPESGKRLFWFEQPGDDVLLKLYEVAIGVLVASEGEGFGLPLVEAACRKLPAIARDLPVFREIAGENVCYFSGTEPENLANTIQDWLMQWESGTIPRTENISYLTWKESTEQFSDVLFNEQWLHLGSDAK